MVKWLLILMGVLVIGYLYFSGTSSAAPLSVAPPAAPPPPGAKTNGSSSIYTTPFTKDSAGNPTGPAFEARTGIGHFGGGVTAKPTLGGLSGGAFGIKPSPSTEPVFPPAPKAGDWLGKPPQTANTAPKNMPTLAASQRGFFANTVKH